MKKLAWVLLACGSVLISGCFGSKIEARPDGLVAQIGPESIIGWTGDMPVAEMEKLPGRFFYKGIGVITDEKDFIRLWDAFTAEKPQIRPSVDFSQAIVILAYDDHYYNTCRIIGVDVKGGIANPVILKTRTSLSIQKTYFLAMAVIPRDGIIAVATNDRTLRVPEVKK